MENQQDNGNLTLEKARIVERLGAVEKAVEGLSTLEKSFNDLNVQVQVFMATTKTHTDVTTLAINALTDSQKKLSYILVGNGEIGLIGKVDNVEKAIKEIKESKKSVLEHRWAVVICVLSAIVGVGGQILVTHIKF